MVINGRARRAVVGGTLLTALTVVGCGTTQPTTRPPAALSASSAPTTTTAVAEPMIGQWIGQYCTQVLMDAETYAYEFGSAATAMPAQGQTDAQSEVQDMAQIASSIEASIDNDVAQVKKSSPTGPADASARTYLLNTYQDLDTALESAQSQLGTMSTADLRQFAPAFNTIAANVSTAIQQSQNAIESYPAFATPLRNKPGCK